MDLTWPGHQTTQESRAVARRLSRRHSTAKIDLWPAGVPAGLRRSGTTELDAQYGQAQALIDTVFKERGWREPRLVSRVHEGAGHNERDWTQRLAIPLRFLLGPHSGA